MSRTKTIIVIFSVLFVVILCRYALYRAVNKDEKEHLMNVNYKPYLLTEFSNEDEAVILEKFGIIVPEDETDAYVNLFGRSKTDTGASFYL